MVVKSLVFYIILLNYAKAVLSGQAPTVQRTRTDFQPMTKFASLLQAIVRVNANRVDAIRKMANLQDYMLSKNDNSNEYYESVETLDTRPVPHNGGNETRQRANPVLECYWNNVNHHRNVSIPVSNTVQSLECHSVQASLNHSNNVNTTVQSSSGLDCFAGLDTGLKNVNECDVSCRSQSSSSSSSMEDLVQTQGRIGLLVPEIPEFPKEQKKTKFERTKHVRNLSNDRERDIFRDDFNISVEKFNFPRSELDYERDGFQNTPKLQIIKKSHPSMERKNKFKADLIAHQRVNKHYTHNPKKEVERAHKHTQIITDFEPETPKKKRKHVKTHKAVSDELDKANAKFLRKMKKAKKSKDQSTSDISMDKTRKDQNNKWNKHKLLKNHSKSQNKHMPREVQNHKKNNKDRHSQPESNKEKRPSSHEKQNIRKKIKSSLDVPPEMSADFVESAIKRPKNLRLNKNINDSPNPRKNEFTLTISDMDENEDNTKDIPYDPFGDSPLLNIDTSKYQSKHKAEPHEPYKQILRENNNDKPEPHEPHKQILRENNNVKRKSTFKDSKAEKQKPIEIGMIDISEQFDGKPFDGLVENIKNEHKDAHVEDLSHKKPDGQHVVENVHDSVHLQPQESESNVDRKFKPNMPINKLVAKKNFDVSLNVFNKEAQSTRKQEVETLGNDFSKAEILLTDDEKDKLAESDNADEKTPLRLSGGGSKKDKRFTGCLGKKALKICRKACRGAYTNVCKRVKCSRNAKRDLKYECTKSCKETFGTSKYSSESSSSSLSSE